MEVVLMAWRFLLPCNWEQVTWEQEVFMGQSELIQSSWILVSPSEEHYLNDPE